MNRAYWIYRNKISNKLWGTAHMPAVREKKGDVLLSYITEPFTMGFSNFHTNYWECYEIARLFSLRGYAVDIINWDNHSFIPKKDYRACVDIQSNFEYLSLPKNCKTIQHLVGSHSDFQNSAELTRLEALKKRRGIVLSPQRQTTSMKDLGIADYLEGFGNKTVHATYDRFNKPIFPIPISAVKLFDFPEDKGFEAARKNFLWFGGGGAVLKGLDLVLETFAQNPDLTLHVCGPVAAERDFALAYKKELFETPNIHTYGRIDVTSDVFKSITEKCGALVYPTFSEGTSGAVVQAMQAGLIPIITPQAGIYEDAKVILIDTPTVDSVAVAVQSFSMLPAKTIQGMAYNTWKYAREHYTRESFTKAYENFLNNVVKLP